MMDKNTSLETEPDSATHRAGSASGGNSWVSRVVEWGSRLVSRSGNSSGVFRRRGQVESAAHKASDSGSQWPDPAVRAMMIAAVERKAASSSAGADLDVRDVEGEIPLLNQALPNYKILDVLDYGGQGVVYRAVQKSTERVVALKVQHFDPSFSDKRQQRFEREVTLVSRLKHPHVVTIFESGMVSGRPYLSMELVDGLTIDDYVLFHRPSVETCVALFEKVCRAVASVHLHGVIHRDLKPSNIRVDLEGVPHILDFGLAKSFDDDVDNRSLSTAGQVIGTLPYLSPEQVKAEDGTVDMRTDIYALGLILHGLLTGTMPYAVNGPYKSVVHNILNAEPKRLDRRSGSDSGVSAVGPISSDLSHVVLKALAKEKERRYQSADALADDLRRCIEGQAVTARGDNGLYLLRKTVRRYRVHAVVGCAFVALLAAFAVTTTVLWQQADENAEVYQAALLARSMVDESRELDGNSRTADAIDKCRAAIEIGERIAESNYDTLHLQLQAHYSLSTYLLALPEGITESEQQCGAAERYMSLIEERYPERAQVMQDPALLSEQRGRIALKNDNRLEARAYFQKACQHLQALLESNSDAVQPPAARDGIERLYNRARHGLARSYFKTEDRPEAIRLLNEVNAELVDKCERAPHDYQSRLQLATNQALIGQCLLYGKTSAENQQAWDMCLTAEANLNALYLTQWADSNDWRIRRVEVANNHNKGLAAKLIAKKLISDH